MLEFVIGILTFLQFLLGQVDITMANIFAVMYVFFYIELVKFYASRVIRKSKN